ncbi:MAG TPA: hypothetical protein VEX86_16105 [Longimicrobium sp.]|nr:hypothetical protein [Longimicrobium sp.]
MLTLAVLPACATSTSAALTSVRAEADLYSGLPNPTWMLDEAEASTVRRLLGALPAGGQQEPSPGLGYRGMVVRDAAGVFPGCTELRAYRAVVLAQCGADTRSLADPGRAVERFLAGTGLAEVSPGAYDAVRKEIEGG